MASPISTASLEPIWWVLGGAALAVALFEWWGRQPAVYRDVSRLDLEYYVRGLLINCSNGTRMFVKHDKSPCVVLLERLSSEDRSATVGVLLPNDSYKSEEAERVRQTMERAGFGLVEGSARPRGEKHYLCAIVSVSDIWVREAGARCARAVWLTLDMLGVGANTTFTVYYEGKPSLRSARLVVKAFEDHPNLKVSELAKRAGISLEREE